VADRVAQAAVKLVLEPIFEADFQPCSYGFRPRRRAQDAIAEVPRLPAPVLRSAPDGESSEAVRERVIAARARQQARGAVNASLGGKLLDQACRLDAASQQLLDQAVERFKLSARGYHRILRVARTIADPEGNDRIAAAHVLEAVGYRRLPGIA
jgi:magnesium chelatase family protein